MTDNNEEDQKTPLSSDNDDVLEDQEKTSPSLEIDNLPNRLTLFRIFLIPLVLALLLLSEKGGDTHDSFPFGLCAALVFFLAALTDLLDGALARRRKEVTVFGSFLDPLADKFLVVSCLITLLAIGRIHFVVTLILVLRELYMTSLRLMALTQGVSVPVSFLGKWKTAIQMIGIPLLMITTPLWNLPTQTLGTALLYLSALLAALSAVHYTLRSYQKLIHKRRQERLYRRLRKKRKKLHKRMKNQNPDSDLDEEHHQDLSQENSSQ